MTSALVLALTIKNMAKKTAVVQLAPYEHDIEAFVRAGVTSVITPQQIISTSLLSKFQNEEDILPSLIFSNTGHESTQICLSA